MPHKGVYPDVVVITKQRAAICISLLEVNEGHRGESDVEKRKG